MQQPVVRIGEWLVTPSVNQISRQGRQITLEPRLIDLLMYFAHHPDEVLSRDNIIDHVWMRTIVTNHVVTQSISELRKSLRDGGDSNAEYIVTVPKRGYKLTAPVIWCEENSDEIDNSSTSPPPPPIAATNAEPAEGATAATPVPPASLQTPTKKAKKPRIAAFWTWVMFLLSLATLVVFIVMSVVDHNAAVTKTRLLLNPRDIDVRFEGGNSCNNWVSQESYAIGLGGLITDLLNTYSTFMVHDKTNYRVNEPSSSGKTLTIQFVNQRHYRAQQCFMSVVLIDNADGSTMLDKRYFVTNTNQLSIQDDLFNSLSFVLTQPWPDRMREQLALFTSLSFRYLDHKTGETATETLTQRELVARLKQHIPEKFFKMVRYFGFLANRVCGEKLPQVYRALGMDKPEPVAKVCYAQMVKQFLSRDPFECVLCGCRMVYRRAIAGLNVSGLKKNARDISLLRYMPA